MLFETRYMHNFRNCRSEDGCRCDIAISTDVGLLRKIFSGQRASKILLKGPVTFLPSIPVNSPRTLD
jgi:hypothetical protein